MRLALVATTLFAVALAAIPIATAVPSPYAGTWDVFTTVTSQGNSPCSSDAVGQERHVRIPIGENGTFSLPARSTSSRTFLHIDADGSLTFDVTPNRDGCPAWSGKGTCSTNSHCDGAANANDGGAFSFRLERVSTSRSATLDQDIPGLVRTEHTMTLVPDGSQSVRLSDEASLRVDAGPDGVGLKVQASVADDPYLLPETRPAVLGKAIDVRYFEFESQVTSGELRAVAITMDLRALGLPKGVAHPDVRFYYWVGDRWVAIDSANVIGQGEPDLVVLDRNVDSAKGQATLTVNHLSAYALALQDLTAPANASEAPAPSAALVMVGLAAVLAGLRHRGWDGRR